ncbi:hypothetical protein BH24GEM2_BH24GEM2_03480 [soil metagenome]
MEVSPEMRGAVGSLLEQRAQLQGWLARLDELSADVPNRVAERVRGDYTERLRGVTDALAEHREVITGEMDSVRGQLADAEARYASSADALEEARLRYQIGELDWDTWATRRPELESAVDEADRATGVAREAVDRLRELLDEIEGARAAAAPGEAEPPKAEAAPKAEAPKADTPKPDSAKADVSKKGAKAEPVKPEPVKPEPAKPEPIKGGAKAKATPAPAPEPSTQDGGSHAEPVVGAEDLEFLEELDRAIAASNRTPAASDSTLEEPQTAAVTGAALLTCKECGSTNDPQSWYCEVCGVEL